MANANQLGIAFAIVVVLAMSYRDLTKSVDAEKIEKDIPHSKLSSMAVPSIKFAFW